MTSSFLRLMEHVSISIDTDDYDICNNGHKMRVCIPFYYRLMCSNLFWLIRNQTTKKKHAMCCLQIPWFQSYFDLFVSGSSRSYKVNVVLANSAMFRSIV